MMAAADKFIIYDNIQFTKKGWIHRNRFLLNGQDELFSLSLKKDSDYKNVCDRKLSDDFDEMKVLRQIKEAYRKAPQFEVVYPIIERIFLYQSQNLFDFIYHSVISVREYLNISTPLIISSSIPIDHDLRSQDKVLAICKELGATTYINPIGGVNLYDKKIFQSNEIVLKFMKTDEIEYPQFGNHFLPHLSILDVMMFNDKQKITTFLEIYKYI